MRVRWWRAVVVCACALVVRSDALPPAALGDVVANAATSLNSMKVYYIRFPKMTSTTDPKELKRKRGIYKGRLTIFATFLSSLNASELTSVQVIELQLRVAKLEELFNEEFDQVQSQLELLSEGPETEISERVKIESQYFQLIAEAKHLINTFSKSNDQLSVSNRHCSILPVKLPTIQLPKFSGSYDNWLEFRDTFTSLVHDNDEIDEINKFHYLRCSLEGSAAVMLQSYEFSAKNYEVAWKLLCERFDNKRLLIQNHVSALFNMEQINRESSIYLKRIVDQVNKHIRALSALGEPVASWDTLLIYIISRKLDTKTFREWEEFKGTLDKNQPILLTQFIQFIQNRADVLETLELSRNTSHNTNRTQTISNNNTKIKTLLSLDKSHTSNVCCPNCKQDHKLSTCPNFLALSNNERLSLLHNYKICYNCFHSGHYSNQCKKPGCKLCKRKHHTLVHVSDKFSTGIKNNAPAERIDGNVKVTAAPFTRCSEPEATVALCASVVTKKHLHSEDTYLNYSGNVLLSTAQIKVYDYKNREFIARALLDSGSSSCLMTEKLHKQLNLPYIKVSKSVQGINNSLSPVEKMCQVRIKSLNEDYCTNIQCFVLSTITDNIPNNYIDICNLGIPSNLQLSDPHFNKPASIDLIIGADIFWSLLGSGRISLGEGNPTLCHTRLGWLVCGPVKNKYINSVPSSRCKIKCNFTNIDSVSSPLYNCDDIQNQLTRFWQLEEVCRQSSPYSEKEKLCEEHFVKNMMRLEDGRFSVRIPLKESIDTLGDSLQRARRCFLSLERKNQNRPLFSTMYKDFMTEYKNLGHMTECSIDASSKCYFMPHSGVLRESSITTKLRVVFNASAPTTSGVSFNNIQMVGPTVQDDLLSILLRFRLYKYVLFADVEKMYRQIAVHPSDRQLQQIIWRDDPSCPLKAYQLNTVTYGTASAPFLATRCLKQIGLECKDQKIAEVILHDFYVDDLLTGENDFQQALFLRSKVTEALGSACMPLRKWKSNEPALISDNDEHTSLNLSMGEADVTKTLGLSWKTHTDELFFPISIPSNVGNTKRDILAVIASIFDPLGLLSPCVIRMKHFMQRLWLEKLSWDDQLPENVHKTWQNIIKSLPVINNLHIPRRVTCDSYRLLELHIFTDASEQAYGACVYLRSVNEQGYVAAQLLVAKSRVAPIKPVTIPRLELCAALVGARLYEKVISSIRASVSSVTLWTDSMVVLGWLKMLPIRLHTFVRNRVAEILEITNAATWRHVPTNQNPADLISRGVDANIMQSLDLWWSGPSFLKQDKNSWPSLPQAQSSLPEIKPEVSLHASVTGAWRRLSSTVSESVGLKHALRRLQAVPARAARLVHALVDRIRVGGGPVVPTKLGSLRGRRLLTRTTAQTPYYSFKGIRYAQSPRGSLRFRPPAPLEPWSGIRDALEEGAVCPHRFMLFDTYKGDEDCLFLNVYTPALPDKLSGYNPKLAVMVWIHGGAFSVGSGNAFLYGPDHLVSAGVVLVTLNYRLGALGFLSLENEEVSGNMGLKDQVMALKWVRDNIEYFGGDPTRITIFGESAGAASVHLHMLSPASQGLFHGAIAESGLALSPWALGKDPLAKAFELGRELGIDTNSTAELLGYLRATPSELLVKAGARIAGAPGKSADLQSTVALPFLPVLEPDVPDAFLTSSPKDLLPGVDVPLLTGYNAQEGIILFRRLQRYPKLLSELEHEFQRVVPPELLSSDEERTRKISDHIRAFYFQHRPIDIRNMDSLIDLFTDVMFLRPILDTLRLQANMNRTSPTYLYRFAFDGALGLFKRMLGISHPGACHGDEMGYLFYFSRFNYRLDDESPELVVSKKMVQMWTNFAKTGNPTPPIDYESVVDFKWEPVNDTSHLTYLDINGNFTLQAGPEEKRVRFWDWLYENYATTP